MRFMGLALLLTAGCTPCSPLELAFVEQGFTVQQGEFHLLVEDCEKLTTCFGNNATTPYFLFSLQGYPNQPETQLLSTIGDIPKVPDGLSASYRLAPNEAIVFGDKPLQRPNISD